MLAARGIIVSHETVRQWAGKFGPIDANIWRRLPRIGDKWHLDEVQIRIGGKPHWLWRAVDQRGIVLDVLVQSRRHRHAAKRLLRQLMKKPMRRLITDKLRSFGAAKHALKLCAEHRQHKGLNNRAGNSHLPTRRRERQMKRFKSTCQPGATLLSVHDQVANLFHLRRDHLTADQFRTAHALEAWADVTGTKLAA